MSGPTIEKVQATGRHSSRYIGRKGEQYFRWQSGQAKAAAASRALAGNPSHGPLGIPYVSSAA